MKREKKNNIKIEIMMWLLSIIVIYPLSMVLITSLKSPSESGELNINLPKKLIRNFLFFILILLFITPNFKKLFIYLQLMDFQNNDGDEGQRARCEARAGA